MKALRQHDMNLGSFEDSRASLELTAFTSIQTHTTQVDALQNQRCNLPHYDIRSVIQRPFRKLRMFF